MLNQLGPQDPDRMDFCPVPVGGEYRGGHFPAVTTSRFDETGEDSQAKSHRTLVIGFLRGLGRHWLLASVLGIIAMCGAAGVVWQILPETFTAQTLISVEANQPAVVNPVFHPAVNFTNFQRTQVATAKSRFVLNAALREPLIAELKMIRDRIDPVAWLEKTIRADFSVAPEIMRISLSGNEPKELELIVNAVREAYLREIKSQERNERNERLSHLTQLNTRYDQELKEKRKILRELAYGVGSNNSQTLANQQQSMLQLLATERQTLAQRQTELERTKMLLAAEEIRQKALEDAAATDTNIDRELAQDPLIIKFLEEIGTLKAEIERNRSVLHQGKSKGLGPKIAQLEAIEESLTIRRQELRPVVIEQLRQRVRDQSVATLATLKLQVKSMTDLNEQAVKSIENYEKQTKTVGKGSIDLEMIKEELAHAEAMARQVAGQLEAAKVEFEAPLRVNMLEEAVVIGGNDPNKRMIASVGAGIGSLMMMLCALGFWELRHRRIVTIEEVKKDLGLRVVGTLPPMPYARHGLIARDNPKHSSFMQLLTESVDATRTLLLTVARAESVRVVMITSADSGEGKTSLSAHLSASLARAGYTTLLVDADLRRPVLHQLFGADQEPGLSELLRFDDSVEGAVRPTSVANLYFMPAGHWSGSALQALAQKRGREIFDSLKAEFDFIIVDTAPVLPVADSLMVSQHVDAVLFSILRDVSRLPAVFAAQERLSMLGARILGAVVNGFRGDVYGANYNYSYSSRCASNESEKGPQAS